ncbi:replication initiation protein [Salinibacter ruber]|jgi:plasmid replication initiation protein|uniref:Plasmid replication initiation protein n=1 Tax=Salinibacter ruber TaxID=146919 RepID=A0A9X2QB37_9BACT|nr:replication initiation protein [Salinibacter ruber]MCS3660062.1 plasmid replication initiation protein [Salinibacter ruber]MCS3709747.1 plasmid replication initiation protein [Salinibacter ruber]MCS4170425.1 plasmid replication initiation protein [Salinibacter ruber]
MSQQVAKSNDLIQGQLDWSCLQQRLVAMLVSQLDRKDERFEVQRVYVKDLIETAGSGGSGLYDQIEKVCSELLHSTIEVRDKMEDGRRRYRGVNPFSSCEYVEGEGYIKARFTEDMRPFLLQLRRRFTTYQLENMIRLRSTYAMRVYELLKMREDLRYVKWPVKELREVLSCTDKYDRFSDFKKRVLEPARKEIAEKCDLSFAYRVERKNQKPVAVEFSIRNGSDGPIKPADPTPQGGEPSVSASEESEEFDLQAMVEERLNQEELFKLTTSYLHEVLQWASQQTNENLPNHLKAEQIVRSTVKVIRKNL